MRLLLFALFVFLGTSSAYCGTWTEVDSETLHFEGDIEADEFERYQSNIPPNFKTLIVNSWGGVTASGLKIGMDLLKYEVEVVVDEKCASSCANYLFTAGNHKRIKNGFVGYHGNVQAAYRLSWDQMVEDMKEAGLNEQEVAQMEQSILQEIEIEADFFEQIGVSQELFDLTQRLDKGMNDGKKYHFLLPSPETFLSYGIENVMGAQDVEQAKNLGLVVIVN